jgi:hypothetical protein
LIFVMDELRKLFVRRKILCFYKIGWWKSLKVFFSIHFRFNFCIFKSLFYYLFS